MEFSCSWGELWSISNRQEHSHCGIDNPSGKISISLIERSQMVIQDLEVNGTENFLFGC
jgi:hypothetical protein